MLNRKQRLSCYLLALTCCLFFCLLIAQLYQLQIVEGASLAGLSQSNSQRLLHLSAPRGQIFSAEGEVLAGNQLVFEVTVTLVDDQDNQELAAKLAALLDDAAHPAETIAAALNSHSRRYAPLTIARYDYAAGLPIISRLEEQRAALPGVQVSQAPARYYPQGQLAGHLLGYVGAIDAQELEAYADAGYQSTDWLGKSGLEKGLETWTATEDESFGLRGQAGIEQVEVTANHRKVQTLFKQAAQAGNNIHLTLRLDLQQVLEEALAATIAAMAEEQPKCDAGAAVLLDVRTGAVLAMASYPALDPNDFAGGLSPEDAAYYWDGETSPSLNRAISAHYPPGSVFKPVTALAVLSAGISPAETVYCSPAAWNRGNGQARCTGSHGAVDLQRAIAVSCNTYFQEMGARVGIEAIVATAALLGLGKPSGIELPNEVAGTLPTPEWKARHFSGWEEDWHLYDTFYTAMGQGYTTVTPLQLASYTATIANNGLHMQPYLLDKVTDNNGALLYQNTPQVLAQIQLPDGYFKELQQAMGLVTQPGGTGYRAFAGFGVATAAKSGTAQTGLPEDQGDNHGLFIAFAPLDAPEVAVACVIEYGQSGGQSAAYVCRAVLAAYFAQ